MRKCLSDWNSARREHWAWKECHFANNHFVPENNPHLIKIKVCCLADSARIRPIVAP